MTPAIRELLYHAADRHGIDPVLVQALATVESGGNPRATSSAGAMGVMQLMPRTAASLGVRDPYDAAQNIDAGVRFFSKLWARFGLVRRALAAYNWGPGNVTKHPEPAQWPASVVRYVERVLTLAGQLAAPREQPSAARPAPVARQARSGLGMGLALAGLGLALALGTLATVGGR